jgi:hypothetical protein
MVFFFGSWNRQQVVREEMPTSCSNYGKVLCIGSLANLASNTLVHKFNKLPTYVICHGMLVMTKVYACMGHFQIAVNTINDNLIKYNAN